MKQLVKKIKFIIEKTDTGFSAYSEDYPIFSTGKNMSKLMDNVLEATSLYYEGEKKVTHNNLQFDIDFKQFFKYYKMLNASLLAEKIGMNATLLSQYVQGKKQPSEVQKKRILQGIHNVGQELSEVNFLYH